MTSLKNNYFSKGKKRSVKRLTVLYIFVNLFKTWLNGDPGNLILCLDSIYSNITYI